MIVRSGRVWAAGVVADRGGDAGVAGQPQDGDGEVPLVACPGEVDGVAGRGDIEAGTILGEVIPLWVRAGEAHAKRVGGAGVRDIPFATVMRADAQGPGAAEPCLRARPLEVAEIPA